VGSQLLLLSSEDGFAISSNQPKRPHKNWKSTLPSQCKVYMSKPLASSGNLSLPVTPHVYARAKVEGMLRADFSPASAIHEGRRHRGPGRQLSLYARSELRKRPKVCIPNMLKIKVFLHT
jgi:hypothetical protein